MLGSASGRLPKYHWSPSGRWHQIISLVPDLVLGPWKPLDSGELQQPGRRGTTSARGRGFRWTGQPRLSNREFPARGEVRPTVTGIVVAAAGPMREASAGSKPTDADPTCSACSQIIIWRSLACRIAPNSYIKPLQPGMAPGSQHSLRAFSEMSNKAVLSPVFHPRSIQPAAALSKARTRLIS